MLASFWGRTEVVKLLLAAGADVHKQDEVSAQVMRGVRMSFLTKCAVRTLYCCCDNRMGGRRL
jgi:hypothetical protein